MQRQKHDVVARKILNHLGAAPRGATIQELATLAGVSVPTARNVIGVISVTLNEASLHSSARVEITRTRSNAIATARLVMDNTRAPRAGPKTSPADSKPTYTLGADDAAAVRKVVSIYANTGRAFPASAGNGFSVLRSKFPGFLVKATASEGLVPSLSLVQVHRALLQYANIGQVPGRLETPAAFVEFDGGY